MLMPNNRPAGIFVLGMHRSGTSAAVLSLESLGLKLCSEADRLRAGAMGNSNPDHGEAMTASAKNDALLGLYGVSWIYPHVGSTDWLDDARIPPRRPAAKAAFNAAHPDGPWACKDPRLCLTLPYWEQ